MTKHYRIAVFSSGKGSNASAIFKHFQHHPTIEVALLLSNNPLALALERAKEFNISTKVFDRQQFYESDVVLNWLEEYQITHVVLAGFLWLIPSHIIQAFPMRIVNIHPALLPKFGGKGMYGIKVHEKVKTNGEFETGITIHLVNENYDEGGIIFQAKCIVNPDDSAEQIAAKVNALEHAHFPRVIEQWIEEGVVIGNG